MSQENLVKLMQAAAEDEQLQAKLQYARSFEELKGVAHDNGFEFGDLEADQARRRIGVMTGEITEELTDEELLLMAGGFAYGAPGWQPVVGESKYRRGNRS